MRFLFSLACLAQLFLINSVSALPFLWIDLHVPDDGPNCTAHPDQAYGRHQPPRPDSSAIFRVVDEYGEDTRTVCPGKDYDVMITFPAYASLLLTTTDGNAFSTAYHPEVCPNQVAAIRREDYEGLTYETTLTIACDNLPENGKMVLNMTWARVENDFYHQVGLTLDVNESCMDEVICSTEEEPDVTSDLQDFFDKLLETMLARSQIATANVLKPPVQRSPSPPAPPPSPSTNCKQAKDRQACIRLRDAASPPPPRAPLLGGYGRKLLEDKEESKINDA